MIENVEAILGIELLAPAQAYEFQHPARARAPASGALCRSLREFIASYADDRAIAD